MTTAASGAQKPALVLLHGFALDARMWRRQVEALSADYRILTVDLPGFGAQARVEGEFEPAAEVGRAMDAGGLVRAHLVGSSFGAAAAVDFALLHPRRVESLTLVGPMLVGRRIGLERWTRSAALAREGDKIGAAEVFLDDPLFGALRRDEVRFDEVRQIVLDYGCGHWTGAITTRWAESDPLPRLVDLEVPTLVVSGEQDEPSFVLAAEAYAKTMPRARREIVQGVGHLVNVEADRDFNALLRSFLSGV